MFATNLLANAMRCTYRTLADSANGRIGLYGDMASCLDSADAQHNVVFEYGNITQWLAYDELVQLEWNVRHVDPDAYFELYPNDNRIHLSTPSPYLCFSFLPDELTELRALLSEAVASVTDFQRQWTRILNESIN
ncbi:hypothetical protein CLV58_11842 [Spirosoma oryzae]|uniref:Uncharacterized protein n=2 Tax=Spirosoma oryzae TaxID=1469603 RepID=A0A2T0SL81_9BACT|nr:hypothetical protein CLV58_11842 [Spirosoma oryzae]